MNKILFFLFVLFVINAFSLELDVEKAISIAYENNFELKELEKDCKIAQFTLSQSFAELFYPSISAGGNYSYQFFTNKENITTYQMGERIIELTNEFSDNYTLSFSIDKTIFNGFQKYNNHKVNELYLEVMKKNIEDKKKELKLNVLESYFKLKLLSSSIETLKLQLDLFSKKYEEAKQKFYLKQITSIDLNKANLDLQNANLELLKKDYEYKKEEKSLLAIIGIRSTNDKLILKNELGDMEIYISDKVISSEVEKVFKKALSNNVEWFTYEYNLKKEGLNKKSLEWSRLPKVSANADYRLRYQIEDRLTGKRSWQGNWSIGLSLSMPLDSILPGSSLDSQIKQKNETIEKIKIQKEAYENSIFNTFKSYIFDLDYYKRALEIQKNSLDISIENLNFARKQKELKQINEIDYINSKLTYLQAKNSYESAYYDYWICVARILRML